MKRSDFYFELPQNLIAQYPVARGASKLLVLNGKNGKYEDRNFSEFPQLLAPEDLIIFNDTQVIPARLLGNKLTGGKVEILIERILDQKRILAQIRGGKTLVPNMRLMLEQNIEAIVLNKQNEWFELIFNDARPVLEIIQNIGHIPLPPYIKRADESFDQERYQTIYARRPGAVAAPTAGLHFNHALIAQLTKLGIASAYITLHVGAGTFQPVRVTNLDEHQMHREWVEVSEETCAAVRAAQARGGKVIAIGTTSVRALESAAHDGNIRPFCGETEIFIYPGYRFKVVDALLTNFHLPESSLLMLVCALGGHAPVMQAYKHAVAMGYRFFSYGDAMFLSVASSVD